MKKKTKLMIIILSVLIVVISILALVTIKYIHDHRYLTYKELEPNQLVLIREEMYESAKEGKMVNVRAIDAEGNLYSVYVPYEEWNGIEMFYKEITQGEKITNHVTEEKMAEIYSCVLEIDEKSDYYHPFVTVVPIYDEEPFVKENCYGIRYHGNGEVEYIKYFEERTYCEYYYLDDLSAEKLHELAGSRLYYSSK